MKVQIKNDNKEIKREGTINDEIDSHLFRSVLWVIILVLVGALSDFICFDRCFHNDHHYLIKIRITFNRNLLRHIQCEEVLTCREGVVDDVIETLQRKINFSSKEIFIFNIQ